MFSMFLYLVLYLQTILGWADQVGPNVRALCEVILRERHHLRAEEDDDCPF